MDKKIETEVVEAASPETVATEEVKEQHVVNKRVQKFMLLSSNNFEYTSKQDSSKHMGTSLLLLDTVETNAETGQPFLRGKTPVVSAFIQDPSPEIINLVKSPVLSVLWLVVSGQDKFLRIHDVPDQKVASMLDTLYGSESAE